MAAAIPDMRVLTGGGLVLEPQLEAHAAELHAVLSDPLLYRYIDDDREASVEALAAQLKRLETRMSRDGTKHWLNWVVRNAEGTMIGYVQATVYAPTNEGTTAEIAYVLGSAYWRRGYAYAAVSAMLPELAASYGVTQLTATLDQDNAASVALVTKLGFDLVGPTGLPNEVRYNRVRRKDC